MEYELAIYMPDSKGDDVVLLITSKLPFLAINRGDILNPFGWGSQSAVNLDPVRQLFGGNRILLRVTGIEHFINVVDEEVTRHKLGIFTQAILENDQSRP